MVKKKLSESIKSSKIIGLDALQIANKFNSRLNLNTIHSIAVEAGAIPRYCGLTGKTIYFKFEVSL